MSFDQHRYQNLLDDIVTIPSIDREGLQRLIGLIDLTLLDHDADQQAIEQLCKQALTPYGKAAAVCIYPEHIPFVKDQALTIATVANFPTGKENLDDIISSIESAKKAGAQEIDVVMPYHAFMKNNTDYVRQFLKAAREAITPCCMKVILETGILEKPETIYSASQLAIENGADFIKTSTGTVEKGATYTAVAAILLAIKDSERTVGIKPSGRIKNVDAAWHYLQMAELFLEKPHDKTLFRIGASSLLNNLLNLLAEENDAL